MNHHNDTIAAIATPAGSGGVGVIRVSGPGALSVAAMVTGKQDLQPRRAIFTTFKDHDGQLIDSGLLLYFQSPASFTGEDVIEFQGHGGHVVMNMLLEAVLEAGARMARPGEFSERAFLNDKIDLVQAEAIADIITGGSSQAVMAAQRSLQGVFSERVNSILKALIETRVWVESAIDFPEEEIDFLSDRQLQKQMSDLNQGLQSTLQKTQAGVVLSQGIQVAIIGKPNAGKSSILNCLTEDQTAIISDVAGTTRDVVKEDVVIAGIPVRLIDTAGIHDTDNPIEQEGIQRALKMQDQADLVLHVLDGSKPIEDHEVLSQALVVINKMDILHPANAIAENVLMVSAKKNEGMDILRQAIRNAVLKDDLSESTFTARKRHVDQLQQTQCHVQAAEDLLAMNQGELSAEELRLAQQALSEITGQFSSDDLLGEIFSNFCIGK